MERFDWPRLGPLWAYRMVAKILAQTSRLSPKPDIVMGFNLYQCGTASGIYGAFRRIPSVTLAVGSDVDQVFDVHAKLLTWIALRLNRHVCVLTTEQEQKLTQRVPRRFQRLRYSFDELPTIERSAARQRLGMALDRIYVLGIGRLQASQHGHIKGFDHLLEAMRRLPQCHLRIIGGGPLQSTYQRFIDDNGLSERVHLVGDVPRERAWDYLAAADIFALPSIHEGLSVAMVEALGFGLPVVASRVGGAVDHIENGANGLLVPPADSVALENALRTLIEDTTLRQRLGRAALDTFRERFTGSAVATQWRAILQPGAGEPQ